MVALTSLQAQVQALQHAQGAAPGARPWRGKPSLLYDFQRAADVDLQTIYELGCQGGRAGQAVGGRAGWGEAAAVLHAAPHRRRAPCPAGCMRCARHRAHAPRAWGPQPRASGASGRTALHAPPPPPPARARRL